MRGLLQQFESKPKADLLFYQKEGNLDGPQFLLDQWIHFS